MKMNQLKPITDYSLSELCKKGGLQDIYTIVHDSANSETPDLTTKKGRDRAKSLARTVSSSKVLFVDACTAHIQDMELQSKEARAELKTFIRDMDKLRDNTKEAALYTEMIIKCESEAYEIAIQILAEEEQTAKNAVYEAQAMENSQLMAVIQNMEFDNLKNKEEIAKFHFCNKESNKGIEFNEVDWCAEQDFKENIAPALVCVGGIEKETPAPRFVMPEIKKPTLTVQTTDFLTQAAAEELENHFTWLGGDDSVAIIEAIRSGVFTHIEVIE